MIQENVSSIKNIPFENSAFNNEKLLKAEIACFYPDLALSFSSKRFITYKNKGIRYKLKSISEIKLAFATRVGIFCAKSNEENYQDEIKEIINKVIESGKVACVEVVEVNPCLDDKGNVMAETAFDVLNDFTKTIEKVIIK